MYRWPSTVSFHHSNTRNADQSGRQWGLSITGLAPAYWLLAGWRTSPAGVQCQSRNSYRRSRSDLDHHPVTREANCYHSELLALVHFELIRQRYLLESFSVAVVEGWLSSREGHWSCDWIAGTPWALGASCEDRSSSYQQLCRIARLWCLD